MQKLSRRFAQQPPRSNAAVTNLLRVSTEHGMNGFDAIDNATRDHIAQSANKHCTHGVTRANYDQCLMTTGWLNHLSLSMVCLTGYSQNKQKIVCRFSGLWSPGL